MSDGYFTVMSEPRKGSLLEYPTVTVTVSPGESWVDETVNVALLAADTGSTGSNVNNRQRAIDKLIARMDFFIRLSGLLLIFAR